MFELDDELAEHGLHLCLGLLLLVFTCRLVFHRGTSLGRLLILVRARVAALWLLIVLICLHYFFLNNFTNLMMMMMMIILQLTLFFFYISFYTSKLSI